jgi:hypothetical protein
MLMIWSSQKIMMHTSLTWRSFLKQKFEMKDLRELYYFLNIEVIESLKGIWLLQR